MELVYDNVTMKNMKKGFTLVEILVAVSIMMIISGLILGGFTFSQRKSRDAKRKSSLSQISRALELFNEDFGRYPIGVDGEIVGCQSGAGSVLEACNWGEEVSGYPDGVYQLYISKLPSDPKVNFDYFYESDGSDINLYAALENDNDVDYRGDLTQECGSGVTCSYLLTGYGVEVE
jgi:prepilin-type N-terminal cleavage/methylation domain-containing protein